MFFANIFGFGNPVEIAIIAGVVVLLFGGSKIATFGKSLGEGMKEFKKASHELSDEPQPTAPQKNEQPISTVPADNNTNHTAEATSAGVPTTKE